MEVFSTRLASFTAGSTRWPHKRFEATPRLLSLSGFYFSPRVEAPDRVECFLCHSSIANWSEADDPFWKHAAYSPRCAWAVLVGPRRGLGIDPDEPTNTEEARLEKKKRLPSQDIVICDPDTGERLTQQSYGDYCHETYQASWPYSEPGRDIEAMSGAGFIYTPTLSAFDAVTCLYCRLCLDNWEPGDKAREEHRKRSSWCQFFSLPINDESRPTALSQVAGTEEVEVPIKASRVSRAGRVIKNTKKQVMMKATSSPVVTNPSPVVPERTPESQQATTQAKRKRARVAKAKERSVHDSAPYRPSSPVHLPPPVPTPETPENHVTTSQKNITIDDLTPEEQMMSVGSFMRHLIQKQVKQIELRGEELILELEAEARKKKRAFISAQGE